MALLTADDIRYRKFAPTRFREGYDVDEVDDFLEEVIQTVDELTRLAQGAATNTGTFAAVPPQDVNSSPVVQGLRAENSQLQAKVQELESVAANATLAAQQTQAGPAVDESQVQELRADNQELVQHLRQAETEITNLQNRVREFEESAAGANAQAVSADAEQLASLNAKLADLQKDYVIVQGAKADIERQFDEFKAQTGTNSNDVETLRAQLTDVERQLEESNAHVARLQIKLQSSEDTDTGSLSAIGNAAAAASSGPNQAAAMLTMAQQLHDEYVQKGKNEAAKIIDGAEEKKEELVRDGQAEHDRLIEAAKVEAANTYETLTKDRTSIEKKIDDLRIFERDYRSRLTQFLEDLLGDISKKKLVSDDPSL